MPYRSGLASGLLLGSALDALLADPRRGHPVAAFGTAAGRAERRLWAASRARGALYATACAGPAVAAGWAGQRLAGRRPLPGMALAAAATWAVLGGASLAAEAAGVSRALAAGDLDAARRRLPALCGRDPAGLPAAELARAAVESVAENTCDAVVAPLLWGALAGVGGLLGYRAVNTLDAMVGHRGMRYERFGWAAARLDDLANLVPARLTAALAVTLAPAIGGSGRAALRTALRDGAAHPSPNAGRCEAAFAGALGVSLGGTNVYQGRAERRGTLGDGPPPGPADLDRAIWLSRLITAAATLLCAAAAHLLGARGPRVAQGARPTRAAAHPRPTLRPRGTLRPRRTPSPRQTLRPRRTPRPRRTLRPCGTLRPRMWWRAWREGDPGFRDGGGGPMRGILVAGTASEAGKSAVTAGICRWLARRGVKVAPFKAQNMSLNSVVTPDGAEIGRAQAMQAAAAGIEPEAALNPVLLKPGAGGTSQVMVLGKPVAEAGAMSYPALKPRLAATVLACLTGLADRFDAVICEGAGSPAEINLREHDLANMGLARAAGLPVIVVADIDRGGALAALYGTLALLSAQDQALVAGFVVNKFRGDAALLQPGLDRLAELTGRPVLGVLPWTAGLWLDAEDSLTLGAGPDGASVPAPPGGVLRVAVVRLPRISNFTDTDPLAAEPCVALRFVTSAAEIADADLVILPGSRATVADLAWLRENGLAEAVAARAARGRPVLGICGGYQMLAGQIRDDVESGAGLVPGLGLLPATVTFGAAKVLRLCQDTADGEPVTGYEIHHGVVTAAGGEPFPGGCAAGAVLGTTWHGILESDGFRRALLRRVAAAAGRSFEPGHVTFAQVRERKLDTLADLVDQHLDTAALLRLLDHGAPAGLPFVPPGVP